jgi:hypothetical protein
MREHVVLLNLHAGLEPLVIADDGLSPIAAGLEVLAARSRLEWRYITHVTFIPRWNWYLSGWARIPAPGQPCRDVYAETAKFIKESSSEVR